MGSRNKKVLELVSGWEAVELVLKCFVFGVWQLLKISMKRLWKGHRRKSVKNGPPVELTVVSSIGTHCYIKVMVSFIQNIGETTNECTHVFCEQLCKVRI